MRTIGYCDFVVNILSIKQKNVNLRATTMFHHVFNRSTWKNALFLLKETFIRPGEENRKEKRRIEKRRREKKRKGKIEKKNAEIGRIRQNCLL